MENALYHLTPNTFSNWASDTAAQSIDVVALCEMFKNKNYSVLYQRTANNNDSLDLLSPVKANEYCDCVYACHADRQTGIDREQERGKKSQE